jgi:hypothetical protein
MKQSNGATFYAMILSFSTGLFSANLFAEEADAFAIDTAGDLIEICTVDTSHANHQTATAFCYGFFEGAAHYDNALEQSPLHATLLCEPQDLTRQQAVAVVVEYLAANPQYNSEPAVDGAFRALIAEWPCPK